MGNEHSTMVISVTVVSTIVGLTALLGLGGVLLVRRISNSVGLAEPTEKMFAEEDPAKNCALFRHLPQLSRALAWRSLQANNQTSIHVCRLAGGDITNKEEEKDKTLEFFLKREDLISDKYGGNKVRTLQHQLAVCESRRRKGERAFQQLVSIGTGGSNQVVATVVHAKRLGWDNAIFPKNDDTNEENAASSRINVCWYDKDEPDMDNTLNMLSVFSFSNVGFTYNWGKMTLTGFLKSFTQAWRQRELVPMMIGGNCPTGVLGQVGGILELAEQIEAGESPNPERIYIAVGSGCTVSGLIVGTVLVRHLGLDAFRHDNFKIVGCNVHHQIAMMDRLVGFHSHPFFSFMPMSVTHTVKAACRALHQLGGPDLEHACMDFIRQGYLDIRANAKVVGTYGTHSEASRVAAKRYDETGVVSDYATGSEVKQKLWICGHFVSKALQPLLEDLEAHASSNATTTEKATPKFMLWMTKSAVQPRGNIDEWEKMQEENKAVKKWANNGKAESTLRHGKISTSDGKPEDYRSLMTEI